MNTSTLFQILVLLILFPAGTLRAEDQVEQLVAKDFAPGRFAKHVANFSATPETFTFRSNGKSETAEFWAIKDGGKYLAMLHVGMKQLDMITFDPTATVEKPPFKETYAWDTLLGVRITAAAWYPEMAASGDTTIAFSGGGKTLTLTTTQTWSGERHGSSSYQMVLRCDPVLGYVWDCDTDLAIDKPFLGKQGEPISPEFFNWQVKVTRMGQRNNQPWPAEWDHERVIFTRTDGRLVGFYINPEANDRKPYKRTEVKEGGFVAKLPGPTGWGVALVHGEKGAASLPNNTCNMWADQHNLLKLPAAAGLDGFHRVKARWRFLALPPEIVQDLLRRVEMDNTGHHPS